MTLLHEDRLFPAEPRVRDIARRLHAGVRDLPIISPHGHTDPAWFAENEPFPNPTDLFFIPDHYLFRMLASQGVPLEAMGLPSRDGTQVETDRRRIWRLFASHYRLFRGTPSRLWLDHAFSQVLGIDERLSEANADRLYDRISERLQDPDMRPRALLDRFRIEVITTTDSALDPLAHHRRLREEGWGGRVRTAFRPDAVVDPDYEGFAGHLDRLGEITGEDTGTWAGYVAALQARRAWFAEMGATSTDHGHPTARTADLSRAACERLFAGIRSGRASPEDRELFRAQMLTEMARMSLEDGLVMQIHPGSWRNHSPRVFARFGRDMGFDMPTRTDYVAALKPLLDRFGMERDLTLILFTIDETTYSRELAPLAGAYPCLRLGPAWWFFDSPEGMLRYRRLTTETCGFYNTVGFNDDTRAFLSIPARHDVARRVDCAFLAELVADHRLDMDEAEEVAADLAHGLARKAYRL